MYLSRYILLAYYWLSKFETQRIFSWLWLLFRVIIRMNWLLVEGLVIERLLTVSVGLMLCLVDGLLLKSSF